MTAGRQRAVLVAAAFCTVNTPCFCPSSFARYCTPIRRASGRPVKLVMSREEVFRATGPTSGGVIDVKLGAKADGTIVYEHQHRQVRALDEHIADEVTYALQQVVQRGTDRSVVFDSITNGVPVAVDVITV